MPRKKMIVHRFFGMGKAAQSFKTSDFVEFFIISSGEKLVGVGLMADIKDEFVFRGIKDVVEGQRQFDAS